MDDEDEEDDDVVVDKDAEDDKDDDHPRRDNNNSIISSAFPINSRSNSIDFEDDILSLLIRTTGMFGLTIRGK